MTDAANTEFTTEELLSQAQGIVTFGSQRVATQTYSRVTESAPTYAVVCSALERSEKGAAPPTAGIEGAPCPAKVRLHPTTSRQPGARGGAEQGHRGDR